MIYKQELIILMTIFSFMSVGWGQYCEGNNYNCDWSSELICESLSGCNESDLQVLQDFINLHEFNYSVFFPRGFSRY